MRTPRFRFRNLRVEQLHARTLMAADLTQVGAFCPEFTSLDSTTSERFALTARAVRPTYTYALLGNAQDAVVVPTPGLALVGGGTDIDAVFAWMGGHANQGDFVVLSTSKTTYPKYINNLALLDSVESLVVPDIQSANDSFVAGVISRAEAIFIAGGDQATYISNWAGTQLEAAIYAAMARGAVLGGSSAGLAVLGDVDYAAFNDSTQSAEALANPLSSSITLDGSFITPDEITGTPLQFLQETITDSHFMQRDRMGRSMAFMARGDADNLFDALPRAISINEQTALLIEGSGVAQVVGNPYAKKGTRYDQQRSVYMMSSSTAPVLSNGSPLNYHVQVQRLNYDPLTGVSDTFSFGSWTSLNADLYTVTATAGILDADMPGNPNVGIYGPLIA